MSSRRWRLVGLVVAALALVVGGLTAQEPAAKSATRPAPKPASVASNSSLAAEDAKLIDASGAVAKPAAAPSVATAAEPAAAKGYLPPDLGPSQVTIFRDGQALVRRVETLDLVSGKNEFTIKDVARGLDPSSGKLRPWNEAGRFTVLEQRGGKARDAKTWLNSALGKDVRLRDGNYTLKAKLLSADDQGVVVADGDEVHVHPKGELIVPNSNTLPDLAPSLTWVVDTDRPGKAEGEVTYLTGGLNWAADYAVTVSERERLVTLDAWVTIDNEAGLDLTDTAFVFADDLAGRATKTSPTTTGRRFYMSRKASLPAGTSRRFVLAQVPSLRGALRYVATLGPTGLVGVKRAVQLQNVVGAHLGMPLPPGPVRLYTTDALGRVQLTSTGELGATDPDQALTFELGDADGVEAKVDSETNGGTVNRVVKVRNLKAEEVTVRVVERRPGEFSVAGGARTFSAVVGGVSFTEITVGANASAELRYNLKVPPAPEKQPVGANA